MRSLKKRPSLNALRAFEAVARHASFGLAADELHVTPGAVSHQISALEDLLGIALFRRDTRSVSLTPAAEASLPTLTRGFSALHEAVRLLQSDLRPGTLTVDVAPAFATRWLLPKLPLFAARHPEIELRVSTGPGLIDARSDASPNVAETADQGTSADLTIRFGRGIYPGHCADKLFATSVTPVCSPRLLTGGRRFEHPDDLRHQSLLHDDTVYFDDPRPDWQVWLDAARADAVDSTRGLRFSHTGLALDAAVDGLGVALGNPLLTAPEIATGRLVAPFALRLPSPFSYYLVHPTGGGERRPEVLAFRTWLLELADRSADRSTDRSANEWAARSA